MKTEQDIRYCRTDGINNENIIKLRLDKADVLDNYASKLSRSDDIATGRLSVAEYEETMSALRYAISYLRGGSNNDRTTEKLS